MHRAKRGRAQEELVRRVKVTRKTVNTIERGEQVPSTHLAMMIAGAFDVAFEEQFQLDD
ncbi:MAG: helix-turn-helix domain-containing protein [Acidobacteriota bacterium]